MIEPRPELSKLSDYVPGKSIEEIRERYGLEKVVKLASNENPLGPSPKAIVAFMDVVHSLHLYPRGNAPKLIDALAVKYGVPENEIVIGNGSDEIIDMVGKAFIRQGDNCIGIRPTFSVYKFTTLSNGADYVSVCETEKKPPLGDFLKAINDKTRVIFICNPNNPTGYYYTESEIVEFMRRVPKRVLVFMDEAYCEFSTAADFPKLVPMLGEFPNLMLNHTFSKIYGLAGLRIGYAIAGEQVIREIWKIKPPFDVNQAAQVAALAALADDDHVKNTLAMNSAGIRFLTESLEKMGYKVLPTEANFICAHIGPRAKELLQYLESHGMIVRGLTSFGLPEWIRVTVGKRDENEFFLALVGAWSKNV